MAKRVKHAPGEIGPECGKVPFRFPQDIAVTTDEVVTCEECQQIVAARNGRIETMTETTVGPQFHIGVSETLPEGTVIHSVRGYTLAPPSGVDIHEEMGLAVPAPTVRYLGRVWETAGCGWVAAPPRPDEEADSWFDEVGRSVRYFASQRDACLYLYGHLEGIGAARAAQALASMPWRRGRTEPPA